MTDSFYAFKHECDAMPDCISFCKLNGSDTSQFAIDMRERGTEIQARQTTVIYGFRYCPYCGEDMEVAR